MFDSMLQNIDSVQIPLRLALRGALMFLVLAAKEKCDDTYGIDADERFQVALEETVLGFFRRCVSVNLPRYSGDGGGEVTFSLFGSKFVILVSNDE